MATNTRGESSVDPPPPPYFDVLLVGKTGMGKSKTGNKLLKIAEPYETTSTADSDSESDGDRNLVWLARPSHIKQWNSKMKLLYRSPFFKVGDPDSCVSTTKQCQLLSNERDRVRVLDMPGFADTEVASAKKMTAYDANLALFRHMLRVQNEHDIQFNRVAYFLPSRVPPEKADANFQEELKIMYYFFGMAIFQSMIIIATKPPDFQQIVYNEDHIKKIKKVFRSALGKAVGPERNSQLPNCPSIVVVPLEESGDKILRMFREASVQNQEGLICKFVDDVCSKCAVKFKYIERGSIPVPVGAYHEDPEHRLTHCHPVIVPKHSKLVRFAGVILSVVLDPFSPTVYFAEEICPHCKNTPGSPGCLEVEKMVNITSLNEILVQHKNVLDEVQVIEPGTEN